MQSVLIAHRKQQNVDGMAVIVKNSTKSIKHVQSIIPIWLVMECVMEGTLQNVGMMAEID